MPKTWRIIDIVQWAKVYFKEKNFDNPRLEIEWLLCSLLDCNRIDIYLRFEEPLSKTQLKVLNNWVSRRIKLEPLQYITGFCNFYGRDFIVNSQVLIPRPETEHLIDITLEKTDSLRHSKILDVGIGSGCIALTLGLERSEYHVFGIDISLEALGVANQNKQKHNVKNVDFFEMDFLKEIPKETFDVIVSNPPYISKEEIPYLMKDVKEYEPIVALTDNSDGLTFYKRFSKIAKTLINPGGYMILEVGINNHPDLVFNLFFKLGYNVELKKDFNGDDRVVIVNV